MSEPVQETFPPELDQALQRYVNEDCPGDVNEYLDGLHIVHLPVHQVTGEFKPAYPGCGDGFHAVMHSYYNKHDGEQTFWTCEPNVV